MGSGSSAGSWHGAGHWRGSRQGRDTGSGGAQGTVELKARVQCTLGAQGNVDGMI